MISAWAGDGEHGDVRDAAYARIAGTTMANNSPGSRSRASPHAQHNPRPRCCAMSVTVEDVVNSPMVASPAALWLDCCVISDGGGALIVTKPEIAKSLKRPLVKVIGVGEAPKNQMGGAVDLVYSAARWPGPPACGKWRGSSRPTFKHASIYDKLHHHGADAAGRSWVLREGPRGGKFVSSTAI